MKENWEAGGKDYVRDSDNTNRAARKKNKEKKIKRFFIGLISIIILSGILYIILSSH